MKKLLTIVLGLFLGNSLCRELHLIDPKSDKCFDSYPDIQPINLSNLTKVCVETIPELNDCQGISLISDEVVILNCDEAGEDKETLQKGCYKLIKQDSSEDIVCQRFVRRRSCEIIKTPANIAIEVHCERTARGIVNVEKIHP
ncbi:uncharacterized protein LOC130901150 [Diorhabda carinulata]|uniref:uncharacterized protein LOC130901150 n=1 Tax=Diorhabda carinulata TaxID=1163345 RepID=UPI0025A0C578|nr:uncharacterized protein LOC130901150 [Diorhabda carinulata]